MNILGISAFYHDSAAALVVDGDIVAASQEERYTRKKHDAGYPHHAIAYCLAAGGLKLSDIDYVAFYDKPFLKFERLLETYLAFAPKGFQSFRMAIPVWLKEKLFQKKLLVDKLKEHAPAFDWESRLLFGEHHQSHAASAFYPSPFEEALILTMDGVGEWATTSVAQGSGNQLAMMREIHFPHSLGLLYSAFTYYTGFKVNSGEYKMMGLAPYGEPKYADLIRKHLIDIKPDGTFRLNLEYFDYCTGLRMTGEKFDALFGGPAREAEGPMSQRYMDLAASIQAVTEEVMLKLTRTLAKETGQKNLCLAGGVALNCVANGKILRDAKFDRLWIQPASGDAGGALGAALLAYHYHKGNPRSIVSAANDGIAHDGGRARRDCDPCDYDQMKGAYLGDSYSQAEAAEILAGLGARFTVLDDVALFEKTVDVLCENRAVGWFQGRMEFGPRALGNRSILGDPRSTDMQQQLNVKVKFRESFRPFAPSILAEELPGWFEMTAKTPYMLLVSEVRPEKRLALSDAEKQLSGIDQLKAKRSVIPAVTHVDFTARIQTVHRETNPRYYRLLETFKGRTGCPVLVNTSFNIRGEPIVRSPEDAFRCFMGTEMEALVVENCFLLKSDQDPALIQDYRRTVLPD